MQIRQIAICEICKIYNLYKEYIKPAEPYLLDYEKYLNHDLEPNKTTALTT